VSGIIRVLLVIAGAFLIFAGLVVALPGGLGSPGGLVWVFWGGLLIVAVALERQRYRSATAERANAPAGPGGGEAPGEPVEPRFRPTSEAFIDPTTGHRMRVLVDPSTGERRYVAEA
jgi:hypothetical protein